MYKLVPDKWYVGYRIILKRKFGEGAKFEVGEALCCCNHSTHLLTSKLVSPYSPANQGIYSTMQNTVTVTQDDDIYKLTV